MNNPLNGVDIRRRIVFKFIVAVLLTLLILISIWSFFHIRHQRDRLMEDLVSETKKLCNTILLGTHYAMMLNSRDDIRQIIQNIARQEDIETIRIYNKKGVIRFSNQDGELETATNIMDEACYVCHASEPPKTHLSVQKRTRIFKSAQGTRLMGMISPIYNEPGCSQNCHFHPKDKIMLGALDVVVSLTDAEEEMRFFKRGTLFFSLLLFTITSAIIFVFVIKFIQTPIMRLIRVTHRIARGNYQRVQPDRDDEIGLLTVAINEMGQKIERKQTELNRQRKEYQQLFEMVPCIITVQNKEYKLLKYNRVFSEKFNPQAGDYCFYAYKGRTEKCPDCPVEKTFEDGKPHYSEEMGVNKDETQRHWVVKTSPVKDEHGEIVAAMEMCLDITRSKLLEKELKKSEQKYYAIFNNIPHPVFVLDPENLTILDCNENVRSVYGYEKNELIARSFLELFPEEQRQEYTEKIAHASILDQSRQIDRQGDIRFVNIRISPAESQGKRVLLVTTSDITKRLEAEQQLIQASKMATLGEMATGVAHELNQPLSVIKTGSRFFMKKINKKEPIKEAFLFTMSQEMDKNVDRATKIINHLREFGRKSEMDMVSVDINEVLHRAFDIFSQQLKIREIMVVWDLEENLPFILGDPNRLEQVFINLLINARDAIEEKWAENPPPDQPKQIHLKSLSGDHTVTVRIEDTGSGIPKRLADKIFEPFFTTKKVGKGTGLGLSISYGIVKDCGGEMRVESDPGQGACFILTFPSKDETGKDEK